MAKATINAKKGDDPRRSLSGKFPGDNHGALTMGPDFDDGTNR
jgi:hypothetical protein